MKKVMRKVSSFAVALLFTSVCATNVYALDSKEPEITERFVAESEYSVMRDDNGAAVIILTNEQPLSVAASRSEVKDFIKTSVAILPTDEEQTKEIISNIESFRKGSGSYTEDGWFYGSSVYLKSIVSYSTTVGSDNLTYGTITKVTISASTNSGSTISSMSLLMGQNGWASGGYKTQSKTFSATTARSFTAPSSWVSVLWDGTGDVGAHLKCTAVRQGGQSTFTLYNTIQ